MQVESKPLLAICVFFLLFTDLGQTALTSNRYAKGHVGDVDITRSQLGQLVVHYYDLYGRFHFDGRGVKVYDNHSSLSGFPYDKREPSNYYTGSPVYASQQSRVEPPYYVGSAEVNLLGRDAEFNIVWQKDTGYVQAPSRFRAVQLGSNESALRIYDYNVRDGGYYRCLATEEYFLPGRKKSFLRTVYKDVIFSA